MLDPDVVTIAVILLIVLIAILLPPGPGSPWPAPVCQ
jgi:ABC-type phosphate transport system auxiliary subunit